MPNNFDKSIPFTVYRCCCADITVVATSRASFGRGTGQILLDDTACIGNESSLFHCSHRGVGTSNCGHSEDAGVICEGKINDPCMFD